MADKLALEYAGNEFSDFLPELVLKENRLVRLCAPDGMRRMADAEAALLGAVRSSQTPGKVPALEELLKKRYRGGTVSVILDDHTRTNHHTRLLLPYLVKYLLGNGVKREKLKLIIATGTHRAPLDNEYPGIMGDELWPAYKDCIVVHGDNRNLAKVGTLDDGAVVEVNETAFSSEILIPLSDLEYHYFAGIAGGPKQICPGICGAEIIRREHLKMFGKLGFADRVESGSIEGNPVFEYKRKVVGKFLDEMKKKENWVYAITVVMNPSREPVSIAGGDIFETHRRAWEALSNVYVCTVKEPADIVIIGARQTGINLFQSGKAYNAAKKAVKKGGKIVLLSECRDGFGNDEFKNLMKVSAPLFRELEGKLKAAEENDMMAGDRTGPGVADRLKEEYVEKAMRETQKVVMADFKIGKQKPVDMLDVLRHTGYGNMLIIQDGLKEDEMALVPLNYIGKQGEGAAERLKAWIAEQERAGKPTYCIMNDPNVLVKVG